MAWLKKILTEVVKLHKSNRKSESLYACPHIFSLPLEDTAFSFCSTSIPEIKKFVKEEKNIDLDEVIVCTFTRVTCMKNATCQKGTSETYLEVIKKDKRYIGILFLKNELKSSRTTELI
jgi:hypothetical protein